MCHTDEAKANGGKIEVLYEYDAELKEDDGLLPQRTGSRGSGALLSKVRVRHSGDVKDLIANKEKSQSLKNTDEHSVEQNGKKDIDEHGEATTLSKDKNEKDIDCDDEAKGVISKWEIIGSDSVKTLKDVFETLCKRFSVVYVRDPLDSGISDTSEVRAYTTSPSHRRVSSCSVSFDIAIIRICHRI